ncbi:MAG: DUF2258 domain-containing protein [Desulfurococcales archaeon]|nr:DUF2258 domain-containing protein [Desulfurococcales archaeon]
MPTLRSGLVIAGAYADKLRRTAFAQLKSAIKDGVVKAGDVAYHVAQLNKVLYRIFVDELKVNKGDVVRVTIDYEVKPGIIEWKFDTLKIEVFKRVPDEEVENVVKSVVEKAATIMESAVQYTFEKIGETEDGDLLYVMKLDEREVGAFEVVPINAEIAYVKKGAALEPNPVIVEKLKIMTEGRSIDEALRENIEEFTRNARYVSREEAEHIIEYIKKRAVGVSEKVEAGEAEE